MNDFSTELHAPDLDLAHPILVEASAGTGKTYNVQHAYLRLILQHGLPVEHILVVTFTEAATHELRNRLRSILAATRDVLAGRPCQEESRIRAILAASGIADLSPAAVTQAGNRIRLALMDFDQAAIFTIHGFCHRVLSRYAFACGHDPLAELVPDASDIIARTCRDWWRAHTYENPHFAQLVPFRDVRELTDLLTEYIEKPDAELAPLSNPAEATAMQEQAYATVLDVRRQMQQDQDLLGAVPDLNPDTPLQTVLALEKQTVHVVAPTCVHLLQQAAAAIGSSIKLTGCITWQDAHTIATPRTAFDVQALLDITRTHGTTIRAWTQRARPYLAGASARAKARALCDAIDCLANTTTPSAKDYLKAIRLLAQSDLGTLLANCRLQASIPGFAALLASVVQTNLGRKGRIIKDLADTARASIQARSVFTYQDMLRNVMLALTRPGQGEELAAILQTEFQAAMIDEFQDTDPIQYAIFKKIFIQAAVPLIFVGDPKQAIYGFRGGDVFTYYRAKQAMHAGRIFGLDTNYRSEPALIAAINAVFADQADRTFLHDAIPYPGTLKAHGIDTEHLLHLPETNDQPLQIWDYQTANGKKPAAVQTEPTAMLHQLADEIVRLLDDPNCRIGTRPIQPEDIAILVHTHAEGESAQTVLAEHGIYAVRQNSGNVFDTPEAVGLERILRAMTEPTNAATLRGALVDNLLPCSRELLHAWMQEAEAEPGAPTATAPAPPNEATADDDHLPASLDDWMALFSEAAALWQQRSFILAFNHLMRSTRLRSHLIRQEDGERKLTNLLHLVELVHQASHTYPCNPSALLDWYAQQRDGQNRHESDEQIMRLTSDEHAVKIMTIYKSKGLQFPIVFVPSLWRKKAEATNRHSKYIAYHDSSNRLVLHLDTQDADARQCARREKLQEDIRLVYVALTRAINRAYLIQFPQKDPEVYALDHILGRLPKQLPPQIAVQQREPVVSRPLRMRQPAPPSHPERLSVAGTPQVDHSHGHTSFSALEPQPRALSPDDPRDLDSDQDHTPPAQAIETNIFSIPGGRQTGNCWHLIFEHIDFQAAPDQTGAITDELLDRFHICTGPTQAIRDARRQAVHRMVQQTLSANLPVPDTGNTFSFRQLPARACRAELAFDFTLHQHAPPVRTPAIRDLLQTHWGHDPNKTSFLAALGDWDRALPAGFMTGLIDLVCCHQDRFFVVDWKSNRRKGRLADFGQQGLQDEMARNAYFLQYLFYTVALHQYLTQHLTGYDYDTHMGGVFYVFLRGIEHPTTHGIFVDRPTKPLITELAALLTGAGGST